MWNLFNKSKKPTVISILGFGLSLNFERYTEDRDKGIFIDTWFEGFSPLAMDKGIPEDYELTPFENTLYVGSFGSGKTTCAVSSLIVRAANNSKDEAYLFVDPWDNFMSNDFFWFNKIRDNVTQFVGKKEAYRFVHPLFTEYSIRKEANPEAVKGSAKIVVIIENFCSFMEGFSPDSVGVDLKSKIMEVIKFGPEYGIKFIAMTQRVDLFDLDFLKCFTSKCFFIQMADQKKSPYFQINPKLRDKVFAFKGSHRGYYFKEGEDTAYRGVFIYPSNTSDIFALCAPLEKKFLFDLFNQYGFNSNISIVEKLLNLK